MAITPQEAEQLLQTTAPTGQQQGDPSGQQQGTPSVSPEEAERLLSQEGIKDQLIHPPTHNHDDLPEHNLLRTVATHSGELGTGVLQGLSNMGYGLAQGLKGGIEDIGKLGEKIAPRSIKVPHRELPKGNIFYGPLEHFKGTPYAEFGEHYIAPLVSAPAGEAMASLATKGLLTRAASYGGLAAATTPGDAHRRKIAGIFGTAGGILGHLSSQLPFMFKGILAKRLEKVAESQKGIAKDLYNVAFKNVGNSKATVGQSSENAMNDILEMLPSKAGKAYKAINRFKQKPNLKNLHILRSDLYKIGNTYSDKALKSGLSGVESDQAGAVSDLIGNISNDLSESFKGLGPEAHNKYLLAQQHYKENVVPFREYSSLRKLFSKEREVSPALYRDLTKTAGPAKALRKLLRTSQGSLQLARIMHHKFLGLPLPVYLALGAGHALFKHKEESGDTIVPGGGR